MPICPQCKKENPELGAKCPRCADSYYVYDEAVSDAERDPYIGQKAADKYVVVARISEGGMGTVYRALQLPVEREVAFKVLRAELEDNDEVRNRFIREARAVSKINHPNIITLHDFGFDASDYPYMVMEYAPGQSLDDWIYDDDITLDRVVHVLRQILSALADAHEQGVVHRDLKPENIMVTGTGTDEDFIKLLDFGIARLVNEQATEGLTREGEVFGTPHYMSPEQAEGETGIGPPADVYALGIMLYEMLCAECPFDAPKPLSILFKQINEELPPLQPRPGMTVPQPLRNLLRQATAKDPENRYPTAGGMLEALDRIDDPDRSGIVQVADGASGHTQRGIGDATAPMEQPSEPASRSPSDESSGRDDAAPAGESDQIQARDERPSRDEMATANTLGFGGGNDGSNPPGDPARTNEADGETGPSNDVSVDEPRDSLFGLEDVEQSGDQTAFLVAIGALVLVFVGGFSLLLTVGGEGETNAAGSAGSDASSDRTAAAGTVDTGGAVAATPDTGPEAGTGGEMATESGDAGVDTGTEGEARAERESDDDSTGSSTGSIDRAGVERAESTGEDRETLQPSPGGRAETETESESTTGSSPTSTSTAGGREDDPRPSATGSDPDPTFWSNDSTRSSDSTGSSDSTDSSSEDDESDSSGSSDSTDSSSEDDESDSSGEIEKFGAPTQEDDDSSDEPEKFGAPE